MKKIKMLSIFLIFILLLTGCNSSLNKQADSNVIEPQETTMKSILELSTMECYYNNVAKFHKDNAGGFFLWKKDKDFWIEYNGIVKFGIDASKVAFEIDGNNLNISIPNAKVLGCKIDESSLVESAYIIAGDSAKVSSEDEIYALSEAQSSMEKIASEDYVLLETAKQRAQILIEDYVNNITKLNDVEYQVHWIYVE